MDKIIKRSAWRGKWRRFCIECLITRSNSSQTARKLDLFSAAANRGGLGWGRCSFAASHASAEIFIIISHSFFRSSERPVIRRNRCQFFVNSLFYLKIVLTCSIFLTLHSYKCSNWSLKLCNMCIRGCIVVLR